MQVFCDVFSDKGSSNQSLTQHDLSLNCLMKRPPLRLHVYLVDIISEIASLATSIKDVQIILLQNNSILEKID